MKNTDFIFARPFLTVSLVATWAASLCFSATAPAYESTFEWKGFLNATYGASDDSAYFNNGINSNGSTANLSSGGLLGSAVLNDKWDASLLLIARGYQEHQFAVSLDWGLLAYKPTDAISVRFGRQPLPLYLISEYSSLALAYPWVAPPREVYSLAPLTSFTGTSLQYSFSEFLGGRLQAEVFTGDISIDTWTPTSNITTPGGGSTVGGSLCYSVNNWSARIAQTSAWLSPANFTLFGNSISLRFGRVDFLSLGTQYNGTFYFISELAEERTQSSYLRDIRGYYATVGYYLGDRKWLPLLTIGRNEAVDVNALAFGSGSSTEQTVGVNYYIDTTMVAKASVTDTSYTSPSSFTIDQSNTHSYVREYELSLSSEF
jgi:hypothetical protein